MHVGGPSLLNTRHDTLELINLFRAENVFCCCFVIMGDMLNNDFTFTNIKKKGTEK
jgi:hypothetical protein